MIMAHERIFLLFIFVCVYFGVISSLSVFENKPNSKTITFEPSIFDESHGSLRFRRSADEDKVTTKINKLNDTHQQLIVHWVGEDANINTNIIICLARNPKDNLRGNVPSAVYYSYDYGDTYVNKTNQFKIKNTYAQLDKFFIHPKYMSHTVFVDSTNKVIFITENHGNTFRSIQLDFTPNEVVFHPFSSKTFLIYDKTNSSKILWLTEDNGESFDVFQMYVKAYDWFPMNNPDGKGLILQREPPDGSSVLFRVISAFAINFAKYTLKAMMYGIVDFHIKGNFIFVTKNESKTLDLYIKYKNSRFMKAKFNPDLPAKEHHVADIMENRVFVVVAHSETLTNLYVSQPMSEEMNEVHFALSLERIFCFFPNITWKGSLISGMSESTFLDLHRVEGMRGIYIASQILPSVNSSFISPEDLVTRITFDWGYRWRPLNLTKQLTGGNCLPENSCSLHLTQKFALWYPTTRYTPILSSQAAPGLIIATGTVGKTMKGQASVYVSRDAGVTWKQVLSDNYYFNFGDHGGIIVAVKFFRMKEDVNTILYSTDEGETWKPHKINSSPMRIYSLMTEPGENTTVFSLFGSTAGIHQWIIIKADFRSVFDGNCTESDYKFWSPKHPDENKMNCLLGKSITFSRRIATRNCYNGRNYHRANMTENCPCDINDFMCDERFYWNPNTSHCVRNKSLDDPYAIPAVCPPYTYYKRTKGYVKISGDECEGGNINYYQPDSFPCPITEKRDMLLLAQKDRIMTLPILNKTGSPAVQLPINGLQNVIAVEYDSINDCVFYADIVFDVISRWCFKSGLAPQKLVDVQLQSIEGMAFDWVSKHLYFVDGVLAKIEVIRTDLNGTRFRKTVINNTIAKKPRGIAVHPMAGYMFWTDWASGSPSINRANLDGSGVLKLFTSPIVEWPNGITIDFIAERIYWVDAKEDYIASADLHGKGFKKILEKNDKVSHPFSVAVFKDDMYWDDWKQNSILVADKDTGLGIRLVKEQLPGLMDLKIYAHTIQEGKNKCDKNNACSHLCFGLPENKFACGCPDDLILFNETKCVCPGGQEPKNKETCFTVDNTCGPNSFKCNNGNCISMILKCDGDDDCGDESDENCQDATTCSPNLFRCASNGKCIPLFWKCDNDYDCADKSDEKDCSYEPCKENHFACDNKRCIPRKWRCDGEDDCHDGSDERNCTTSKQRTCSGDEYLCGGSELTCIPITWRCDNEKDCSDGSDENNCTLSCADGHFTCANKKCILANWKCDGENDCGDGSDEVNCTDIITPIHSETTVIPTTLECKDFMFKCNNNKCIPHWWKCDAVNDCGDYSDEIGCTRNISIFQNSTISTTTVPNVCGAYEFRCAGGNCIADAWVCDGIHDCLGGEDEKNCNRTNINLCKRGVEFRCRITGICIPIHEVCDGIVQCPDGTDEGICNKTFVPAPTTPCNYGNFSCDNGRCLPLYHKCDDIENCIDLTDEANCTKFSKTYQVVNLEAFQTTERSVHVVWTVQPSYKEELKYLPSIKINNTWKNATWITRRDYLFTKLSPYTTYTITVYVANDFLNKEYPPAFFYNVTTLNGEPSPPLNVIVEKKNISVIEVKWSPPLIPNGQLQAYTIFVSPPIPPLSLSVNAVRNNATLYFDFEADKEYTVTVTAKNDRSESAHSAPVKFRYENSEMINGVQNLKVDKKTENSVTLSWKKTNISGVYSILPKVKPPYPAIKLLFVNDTPYTVTNLSPGVEYTFEVSVVNGSAIGNAATIVVETEGVQLPTINNLKGSLAQSIVKLTWDPPKEKQEKRKTPWKYGIYYGITMQQLFQIPKNITESSSFNVYGLPACMLYTFGVGVVLQNTYGPISDKFVTILTPPDAEATPLNLNVAIDPTNDTNLIITWTSSCPKMINAVGYVLVIQDVVTRVTTRITIPQTKNTALRQTFVGNYGAKYKFTLSTKEDLQVSTTVEFQIPPCPPPHQVIVYQSNSDYTVTWDVRNGSPTLTSKKYKFEVLANEGNHIDLARAKSYFTNTPPLKISNLKDGETYTFAVRIVSDSGDQSMLSEEYTVDNRYHHEPHEQEGKSEGGFSYTWLTILLLLAVGSGIVFTYWRHKRSHINFKNLANSHYNTRSGSTTFTGVNGLDLEDSPEIREHFSDDEPLVIA